MVPTFKYDVPRFPLSVVVLSHNRLDELKHTIPGLMRFCFELGYELIVVDNASQQEIRSYLAQQTAFQRHVVLVQNDVNRGVAAGRNTAYAVVNGEFILAIDDDTRVSFEILRDLPGLMRDKYPQVGILALRVLHAETNEDQNHYGEQEQLVANHHGAACAIRREVLSRIGGIDDYCAFGSEEIDLCIRAHAAGFEIRYIPGLVVYHNSIIRQKDELRSRVQMRVFNNARTMHKYFPFLTASRFSNRYLGWMSLGWIIKRNFNRLVILVLASLRGRYLGLRHRTLVPKATAAYYATPNLKPEFGNAPFFRPLLKRWLLKAIAAMRVTKFSKNDNV